MKYIRYVLLLFVVVSEMIQCQVQNNTMHPAQWGAAEREALIEQIGLKHLATIFQSGGSMERISRATIIQYDSENIALIEDHGENNSVTIRQSGLYQQAEVLLEGDNNDESIYQRGLNNLFLLESELTGTVGVFSQEGKGNILTIRKSVPGSIPLEIHQIGNEMKLIVE